jgi:EAL domain-containing protein (putative c-di-GMP-specific phosphodiesterase class I)
MVGDDGRLVPPTSFLLAAERSTLILDVDRWVLHEAVRELARRQADDPEARLAVNLSARSLTDPQLIEHVAVELAAAGADPCGLVLEITETAAVVNVAQARSFIRAMSELGCELSLDDFGAGFTSLQYLKHLDFDYLKIDGEFVRDLTTSPVNQSIVRAIADLARSLGKRTVAEHVGDRTSLEWLRAHGVDYAQGFHLGLPRPLGAPDTTLARIPAPRG